MQQSLRQRLTYGTLMLAGLLGMLYLDYWIEQKTHGWVKVPDLHPELYGPREFGLAGVDFCSR